MGFLFCAEGYCLHKESNLVVEEYCWPSTGNGEACLSHNLGPLELGGIRQLDSCAESVSLR